MKPTYKLITLSILDHTESAIIHWWSFRKMFCFRHTYIYTHKHTYTHTHTHTHTHIYIHTQNNCERLQFEKALRNLKYFQYVFFSFFFFNFYSCNSIFRIHNGLTKKIKKFRIELKNRKLKGRNQKYNACNFLPLSAGIKF